LITSLWKQILCTSFENVDLVEFAIAIATISSNLVGVNSKELMKL